MSAISFGLACLGCILLSLSLKRHFRQVFPDSLNYARWMKPNRTMGFLLILVAAVPCLLLRGPWIGLVLWISILALAAFTQGMLLTYAPKRSMAFGGASLFLILAGLAV